MGVKERLLKPLGSVSPSDGRLPPPAGGAVPRLELRGVGKSYSSRRGDTEALRGISLSVAAGEFVCLVGPSGCGKSTLLSIVAGLEKQAQGDVLVDGAAVTGPGRDRVMIFQEPALFPWLDARSNVAFGLRHQGLSRADVDAKVSHYIHMVRLDRFAKSYVHELSGGMKQRVALARALALEPSVLLMDEPFAALDAQTRDRLHDELQTIWASTGKTILFVTHNVREAMVLGDRVLLLSTRPGRITHEYPCALPRPRRIEDHDLVDGAREVIADLKAEVAAAEMEES